MKRKNGQIMATDLFLAVALYVLVMIAIIYIYASYTGRLNDETNYRNIMLKAFEVSDNILKHSGSPSDWDTNNVKVIGLAERDHVLSTKRIAKFVNLSYNRTKHILGLSTYEYFIQIRNTANQNLMESGASPKEDTTCNASYEAVTLRRFSLWEGQKVIVYVTIWDDNCLRSVGQGQIIFGESETYIGTPETAYEEDNNPTWSTQIQEEGDFQFATALDEEVIKPDYIHFNFPNLGIPASARISNITLKIIHREDLAGGNFPPGQEYRKTIRCWNGAWIDIEEYATSTSWTTYEVEISNCINTIALANNIHIVMNYDPALDIGGTQDIDLAQVTVKTL